MLDPQRPRTIAQLHAEMVAEDPACALTMNALRRLVRSGEIRSCRVGQKYLVTYSAVSDFLSGKSTAAPLPAATVHGIRRVDANGR